MRTGGPLTDWQHQVAIFMREVKGLELPTVPVAKQAPLIRELCTALMTEELRELRQAMLDDDLVLIADGLADLLYVTLYTANAYGLFMGPIFKEVQRSNMTKAGGAKSDLGKQLKPDGYSPPNLKPIIEAQS